MSARIVLTVGLLAAAQPLWAAEPAGDLFGPAMPSQVLGLERGGTNTGTTLQLNATAQNATNSGNFTVSGADTAILANGAVSGNAIAGNSGITTVMSNTGNQVNLSNSTSVIVNMR